MANSRDACLCRQHFITYAAVAAFRQTVLGAGRCNCCIRYLLVTRGGNNFLFHQHFLTYAAVLSFGFTVLGAGRGNCCIYYHGMTRCFEALPLLHDLTTGIAFLFRGITIFCTGIWHICLCLYNVIFIMICFRDLLLFYEHFFAELTTLSICQTGMCTVSLPSPDCFGSVLLHRIWHLYSIGAGVCFPVQGVVNYMCHKFIMSAGCCFRIPNPSPAITGKHFAAFRTLCRYRIRCCAFARRCWRCPRPHCFIRHHMFTFFCAKRRHRHQQHNQ